MNSLYNIMFIILKGTGKNQKSRKRDFDIKLFLLAYSIFEEVDPGNKAAKYI